MSSVKEICTGEFRFISYGGLIGGGQQKWIVIHHNKHGKEYARREEWRSVDIMPYETLTGLGAA